MTPEKLDPTEYQIAEALYFAKPGRILPLDDEGNMSAQGVSRVINAMVALAAAYRRALSDSKRKDGEMEGLREQLAHWQASSKMHSESATKWHGECKAAESALSTRESQIETFKSEQQKLMDAVMEEHRKVCEALADLKTAYEGVEREGWKVRDENFDLAKALAEARRDAKFYEDAYVAVKIAKENLSKDFFAVQAERDRLAGERDELLEQQNEHSEEIARLAGEVDRMKKLDALPKPCHLERCEHLRHSQEREKGLMVVVEKAKHLAYVTRHLSAGQDDRTGCNEYWALREFNEALAALTPKEPSNG